MRARAIASATHALLRDGRDPSEVLTSLRTYLAQHRMASLLPRILREVLRRQRAQASRRGVVLRVARQGDVDALAAKIKAACAALHVAHPTATDIDHSLIGGFQVATANHILDASYKHQLETLYRRSVAAHQHNSDNH